MGSGGKCCGCCKKGTKIVHIMLELWETSQIGIPSTVNPYERICLSFMVDIYKGIDRQVDCKELVSYISIRLPSIKDRFDYKKTLPLVRIIYVLLHIIFLEYLLYIGTIEVIVFCIRVTCYIQQMEM